MKKEINGFEVLAVISWIITIIALIASLAYGIFVIMLPFLMWSGLWVVIWHSAAKSSKKRQAHRDRVEHLLAQQIGDKNET